MSISTIPSAVSPSSVQSINAPATPPVATTNDSNPISGVTVDISKPGQLFSQLASLAQSDPTKFKAVTADIAAKLKDAAAGQTGRPGEVLSKLADRFTAASQSGDASSLAPRVGHPHGRGHHHAHAASAASAASAAPGAEPNDTVAQQVQGIISTALADSGS